MAKPYAPTKKGTYKNKGSVAKSSKAKGSGTSQAKMRLPARPNVPSA